MSRKCWTWASSDHPTPHGQRLYTWFQRRTAPPDWWSTTEVSTPSHARTPTQFPGWTTCSTTFNRLQVLFPALTAGEGTFRYPCILTALSAQPSLTPFGLIRVPGNPLWPHSSTSNLSRGWSTRPCRRYVGVLLLCVPGRHYHFLTNSRRTLQTSTPGV